MPRSGQVIVWKLISTFGTTCLALNGQRFVCFALTGLFYASIKTIQSLALEQYQARHPISSTQ